MLGSVKKSALLLAGVSGLAAFSQLSQEQLQWYRAALAEGIMPAAQAQAEPLENALLEWKRLQQSDNYAFSDYANFLLLHPGWPGETGRRAAAETAPSTNGDAFHRVTVERLTAPLTSLP